ncbi:hypothetical protein Hanom_Chr09g00852421 [Helianthus anomalus]
MAADMPAAMGIDGVIEVGLNLREGKLNPEGIRASGGVNMWGEEQNPGLVFRRKSFCISLSL